MSKPRAIAGKLALEVPRNIKDALGIEFSRTGLPITSP